MSRSNRNTIIETLKGTRDSIVVNWVNFYTTEITEEIQSFRPTGDYIKSETLYHRDDALLYIAYVMLILAAPIPADRWHCSLWP